MNIPSTASPSKRILLFFFSFESCINGVGIVLFFFWFLSAEIVCDGHVAKERDVVEKRATADYSLSPPLSQKEKVSPRFFFFGPTAEKNSCASWRSTSETPSFFFLYDPSFVCTRYVMQLAFHIGRDRPKWSKACFEYYL